MAHIFFYTILFVLAILPQETYAASSIGGSIEDYRWQETIDAPPLSPQETGQRYAIHIKWNQDKERGVIMGYRGKFYAGQVHYDTFTQSTYTPVATTTQYSGAVHEGQMYYRFDNAALKLDLVGGLGLDTWERSIANKGYNQIEDFLIIYLRSGIHIDQPAERGFHGAGGLKYPVYTWEDAHLDNLGYTSNPTLKPGKAVSLYGELGYRISKRWDITGYYDSWRFKRSDTVFTTDGGNLVGIYQPESRMDAYGVTVQYLF